MKPWMLQVLAVVAGIALGIVVAKYTLPPRTVTRTETKFEEKIVYQDRIVKEQGPVRITERTVTVPGPQGPTVTVDRIIEKEKIVTVTVHEGASETREEAKTEKIVDARSWFALEGMAAISLDGRWAGAGSAQIRLLGPLWVGAGVIKADTWYPGAAVRWEF